MRHFIIFAFLFALSTRQLAAQTKIISFAESRVSGPSIADLDVQYKNALHADTSLAVFKTDAEQTELIKAYQSFVGDMGGYLIENGFEWPGPTRIFNRFYVDKDGEVMYYIYNVLGPSGQLTGDSAKEFERLMASFFKAHKFGITAQARFAQCSPVVFQ